MSNRLSHLLARWRAERESTDWVLGSVYKTEGSAYRKAGAFMLLNAKAERLGLLSGGCLEADIQTHAKKVMQTGKALTLLYDATDEDGMTFRLGLGCGGVVHIVLQPVTAANDLDLSKLHDAVRNRRTGTFYQRLPSRAGEVAARFETGLPKGTDPRDARGAVISENGVEWLATPIVPDPHLLIVGGGADARPMVRLAKELGWHVSLCDPRPANARLEDFPDADKILRDVAALNGYSIEAGVDAAVIMGHARKLDGEALAALAGAPLKYLALLGPKHRRQEVLDEAGVALGDFSAPLAGPAGLDIGSDFPEGVALSILAECHAAIKGRNAKSLSGVL